MKTVAEIRSHVREFYDLTSSDLSDNLIDTWTRGAYLRIVASRPHHPWLQSTVTASLAAGDQTQSFSTLRRIIGVRADGLALRHIDHQEAAVRPDTTATSGGPRFYSTWADQIYIWPSPTATTALVIEGYLRPVLTWSGQTGQTPTYLPDDYEPALLSWILCEAAKWQQDIASANNFAQDFAIQLEEANARWITTVGTNVVLNGGHVMSSGRSTY